MLPASLFHLAAAGVPLAGLLSMQSLPVHAMQRHSSAKADSSSASNQAGHVILNTLSRGDQRTSNVPGHRQTGPGTSASSGPYPQEAANVELRRYARWWYDAMDKTPMYSPVRQHLKLKGNIPLRAFQFSVVESFRGGPNELHHRVVSAWDQGLNLNSVYRSAEEMADVCLYDLYADSFWRKRADDGGGFPLEWPYDRRKNPRRPFLSINLPLTAHPRVRLEALWRILRQYTPPQQSRVGHFIQQWWHAHVSQGQIDPEFASEARRAIEEMQPIVQHLPAQLHSRAPQELRSLSFRSTERTWQMAGLCAMAYWSHRNAKVKQQVEQRQQRDLHEQRQKNLHDQKHLTAMVALHQQAVVSAQHTQRLQAIFDTHQTIERLGGFHANRINTAQPSPFPTYLGHPQHLANAAPMGHIAMPRMLQSETGQNLGGDDLMVHRPKPVQPRRPQDVGSTTEVHEPKPLKREDSLPTEDLKAVKLEDHSPPQTPKDETAEMPPKTDPSTPKDNDEAAARQAVLNFVKQPSTRLESPEAGIDQPSYLSSPSLWQHLLHSPGQQSSRPSGQFSKQQQQPEQRLGPSSKTQPESDIQFNPSPPLDRIPSADPATLTFSPPLAANSASTLQTSPLQGPLRTISGQAPSSEDTPSYAEFGTHRLTSARGQAQRYSQSNLERFWRSQPGPSGS